jgi:hypothetical protein
LLTLFFEKLLRRTNLVQKGPCVNEMHFIRATALDILGILSEVGRSWANTGGR